MNQYAKTSVINPLVRIRRDRYLPKEGEVTVRQGQDVSPMHVLARTPLTSQYHVFPIAKVLGIEADEVSERLQVQLGETVNQETVLAETKRLFGSRPLYSPVDGKIVAIENGRLIYKQSTDWLELRAMAPGRIVDYEANLGVTIEIVGAHIQAVWAGGDITIGELHLTTESGNGRLTAESIPERLTNLILVAGQIHDPELLSNLADTTVRGIIAGSMPYHVCEAALAAGLSVLLTDGIGQYAMAEPIFQLLQTHAGQEASLFTIADLKSGERPEIIIPHSGIPKVETLPYNKPLAVGNTVRLLGDPFHGQIGTITQLLTKRQRTAVGLFTRGAMVQLSDQSTTFVPTANIDVLI